MKNKRKLYRGVGMVLAAVLTLCLAGAVSFYAMCVPIDVKQTRDYLDYCKFKSDILREVSKGRPRVGRRYITADSIKTFAVQNTSPFDGSGNFNSVRVKYSTQNDQSEHTRLVLVVKLKGLGWKWLALPSQ